jgi:hypothetical protein
VSFAKTTALRICAPASRVASQNGLPTRPEECARRCIPGPPRMRSTVTRDLPRRIDASAIAINGWWRRPKNRKLVPDSAHSAHAALRS